MSVRTIFLGPQYEYRRNTVDRDSISINCNRGDLPPDRHQAARWIASHASRLRHASADDRRYRSHAWAAFVICLGAEHKHSRGRLVGICVFVARFLHRTFWHVWNGLRADHHRSCQRGIVYFVCLDLDGHARVWRALRAAACALRWSGALAARQPNAVPGRVPGCPRSARLRYYNGLYLAGRLRVLAWSQRSVDFTMADDLRLGCLRRPSLTAHPTQLSLIHISEPT